MNTQELLTALAAALADEGPAVKISPDGVELIEAPEGIALVVGTSGSTGAPKQTMLSVDALAASSMATALALGGEGQWLLALPVFYVAGAQVLIRSLFAGTRPAELHGDFSPESFSAAATEMTDPIRYTSLVPTQLARLLDAPESWPALRRFNAVLLGGAPASEQLLARARELGIKVVTTYGSAETCGGCVYDGDPLEGVELALRPDSAGQQVIWLGGAVLAEGYLDDPARTAETFQTFDNTRWYRTSDLGEWDERGALRVLGRADDVLITGGLKVSAQAVADSLRGIEGVHEAFVTGLEDAEWGQKVVAAVVSELAESALHQAAAGILAPHAVPKTFLLLKELPLLPQGKIDRQSLLEQLQAKDRGK
ncbi:O-succinylbenzoic acid--CoA ligase [Psychromicrobium silvestre]|uniref:O-succinylbenzoic acid--CoA ligase n=1 Tax=Psychromicrobium silvestre TaxID=1645614 RepID=A0A7Y9LU06_9MICC|nr:AMP-binding protein [Psychromicrobium silvestre]NYE95534.1 O-succinylbenzoic acid--CoA ligase [Psychromicrobium silvestre]